MQSRARNSLFSFNAHSIDLTGEVHGLLLGNQLHGNGQCVCVCVRKCECSSESILASGGRRAQWFCSADGRVQTVRNRPDVFLMAPLLSGNRCTRLRAVKPKPPNGFPILPMQQLFIFYWEDSYTCQTSRVNCPFGLGSSVQRGFIMLLHFA